MVRVNPHHGFAETVDADVVALLARGWRVPVTGALLAYNDMTKVTDPRTGESLLLIGLQARINPSATAPFPTWERRRSEATYLVRRASRSFEVHEMSESAGSLRSNRVAVRTMVVSPFASDTLYAGGFDANRHPVHDTGLGAAGRNRNGRRPLTGLGCIAVRCSAFDLSRGS